MPATFVPTLAPGGVPSAPLLPGGGGSFSGTPVASPRGLSLAFGAPAFEENPAWTWIDDPAGDLIVQGFRIDRGRSYEFDRTGTGTASVTVFDTSGDWDPTNSGGAFYGDLEPMTQAALAIYNPAGTWSTVFRGFVSDWRYLVHPTENYLGVEIMLVDALDPIAATELVPGGSFGNPNVPAGTEGDVWYPEDLDTDAVQTRINMVLDQLDFPAGLRSIFTGNVKLRETVYPSRTSALSVIQDAADAEFPGVANFYVSREGVVTFHGRFARFNPTNVTYQIDTWQVGDTTAHDGSPTTVAPIVPPLEFARDKEHLYTSAIATPQGIDDSDIAGQYVTDAAAAAKYGLRTWSAENLLTLGGDGGTTPAAETKKFATYYVDNYKSPRTRVGKLSFHAALSSGNRASVEWQLVCGIDIGDRVLLTTSHQGGGGFNDYFFVEGVHYDVKPLNSVHADVMLTLDLSPAGYYSSNPFD